MWAIYGFRVSSVSEPKAWVSVLQSGVFVRFIVAGIVNSLFGFMVVAIALWSGLPVWAALLAGMLLGSVFNFFTTGGYAFRQLSRQKYPRFVLCYLLVYGTNLALIELLLPWTGDPLIAQGILLVPLALLSYVLMARWVFVKNG